MRISRLKADEMRVRFHCKADTTSRARRRRAPCYICPSSSGPRSCPCRSRDWCRREAGCRRSARTTAASSASSEPARASMARHARATGAGPRVGPCRFCLVSEEASTQAHRRASLRRCHRLRHPGQTAALTPRAPRLASGAPSRSSGSDVSSRQSTPSLLRDTHTMRVFDAFA